jgi:hypothetical protein
LVYKNSSWLLDIAGAVTNIGKLLLNSASSHSLSFSSPLEASEMDMDLNFSDMAMDFDALDVLPGYNLQKKSSVERVARLRQLLVERGLDGYLIVDSDAHYTFYAQARKDRRINYITNSEVPFHLGFTG